MAYSSVIFTKFLYTLNISDSIARLMDLDIIHVLDLQGCSWPLLVAMAK